MYDNEIGTITDGKVDIKDITFATVQTMAKLDLRKNTKRGVWLYNRRWMS